MSSTPLSGQIIIVTGASAGIGTATARTLARAGAIVVLAARRADRLDQLKTEIEQAGGRALSVVTDINSEQDRKRLVDTTLIQFGRIDGLVNNAGFGQPGPVEMALLSSIRQQFETNVFSLLGLTQLVLPHMRRQQSGRIVNVGSVAGRIARPFSSIYDATKHALEAFSDGLRNELAPFGVNVILIEPGFIRTEFSTVASAISADIFSDPASPYAGYLNHRQENYKKYNALAGPPEAIADVILKSLTAKRPRTRYAAPFHAKVFLLIRWLLPDSLMDWFNRRQYGLNIKAQNSAATANARSARQG